MTSACEWDSVTFVLCIEDNAICAQALLLCESIRQFGGRQRNAPIFAVAPRQGLGIGRDSQRRLDAMGVEYVETPLNRVCPEYGSANRVFAAAWAETHAGSEWVVALDSDTLLLDALELPTDADIGVRPVDVKGSATEGPGDVFEDYWTRVAGLAGMSLDRLPFIYTTCDERRIRAAYNGGLVVVRRGAGILSAWADVFARSVAAGLKPWRGSGLNIRASTGHVGLAASEYWGSNQTALAVVTWSLTTRVHHYPDSYNLPLHLLIERPALERRQRASPVHVHYHWLFAEADFESAVKALGNLGAGRDRLSWLIERLPLR